MNGNRVVRVWAQIGLQSLGAPVSMAHVCAAAGYPEMLVVVIGADGQVLRRFIRPEDPGAFVRAALAAP